MNEKTVKKIVHMMNTSCHLENVNSTKQNILKILLPTLILDELKDSFENGNIRLSSALIFRKMILSHLDFIQIKNDFDEIMDEIIVHLFQEERINYFQFSRDELEYYRMYFAGYVSQTDQIRDVYYEAAYKISQFHRDESFSVYLKSQMV